jgi:hypothetical protein
MVLSFLRRVAGKETHSKIISVIAVAAILARLLNGCGGKATNSVGQVDNGGHGGRDASAGGFTGGAMEASTSGASPIGRGGGQGGVVGTCSFIPACHFGEQPVILPGECCPTQCGLPGVTDAAACFGIPCLDTHGCWCAGGVVVPGIACGASGTCEACSTNGLNDPCLGRPPDSPGGPDCCPGLRCLNSRCVP